MRLYDTINANADWLPHGLGVGEPLIKPKGIDDVPIVTLTLLRQESGHRRLRSRARRPQHRGGPEARARHARGDDPRRPGPRRAWSSSIPTRMAGSGVTVADLRQALQSANLGTPIGELAGGQPAQSPLEAGPVPARRPRRRASWSSRVRERRARVPAGRRDGARRPAAARALCLARRGRHQDGGEYPAVTIAVTKKPGENAIDVADAVMRASRACATP